MPRILLRTCALALLLPSGFAQDNLRAWHAHGQTWLVWEHDQAFEDADTYEIYRAGQPIVDLAAAERVGRIFPEDGRASRLQYLVPGANWTVPDGAGGTYALLANELLFVYTTQRPGSGWFAVVQRGETAVGPSNSTGPVAEGTGAVQCHPVASGTELGHPYTVYAHWIDGRADPEAGRDDYPVMGAADFNGTGHLFAVYEPAGGLPPTEVPAVFLLHGGTGNFSVFRPAFEPFLQLDLDVPGGLLVSADDGVHVYKQAGAIGAVREENTRWFGYWEEFDRFDGLRGNPPDRAVVIDYTLRRLDFIRTWLIAERAVDPARVSMMGISMGGMGTSFYARRYPEHLSAGHVMVPSLSGGGNPFNRFMQGRFDQNLATNLLDSFGTPAGLSDLYSATKLLRPRPIPFLRFTFGTNDMTTGWAEKVPAIETIEDQRWGSHVYWDEREHGPSDDGWTGVHWAGSPRQDPAGLTRERADRSYPAISASDHDPAPGRQPDVGDAVEPANGDPWGTWGGYFDWVRDTLVDQRRRWETTLFVVSASSFPGDVPVNDDATCDVSLRRTQRFRPPAGAACEWILVRLADDALLGRGIVIVPHDRLVTIPGLTLSKSPARLTVRLRCLGACDVQTVCAGSSDKARLSVEHLPETGELVLAVENAPPHTSGAFYVGTDATMKPRPDGSGCLSGARRRLAIVRTDAHGGATIRLPVPLRAPAPAGSGASWTFQFSHPGSSASGFAPGSSDALELCLCR